MSDKYEQIREELKCLRLIEPVFPQVDFLGDSVSLDGTFLLNEVAWVLSEMLRGRDDYDEEKE